MSEAGLSRKLLRLVRTCAPTVDALELLVFLARNPGRSWNAKGLASAMHSKTISESAIYQQLKSFKSHGLVAEKPGSRFQFEPLATELEAAIGELVTAHMERPVTLIRAVYAQA